MEAKTEQKALHKQWYYAKKDDPIRVKYPYRLNICQDNGYSNQTAIKWEGQFEKQRKKPTFDLRQAFLNNQEVIWDSFMDAVKAKKISPNVFRTFAQLAGELVEKREDTVRIEPTPDEYITIAQRVVQGLQDSYRETGGMCLICGQCQVLDDQPCLDTKREHNEEGEVATLALST